MQVQADLLDLPVVRPTVVETTALGAAYAAGLAVGVWSGTDELAANWSADRRWTSELGADERRRRVDLWAKAVRRSLDWME
jgi:glycerol kinase